MATTAGQPQAGPRAREADITRNYHGGNPESVAAFESTPAEERRRQRSRVLAYIRSRGPAGATSDEAELALGMVHQGCSARFTELKRDGDIIASGQRRPTRSGRQAAVFIVPAQEPEA